MAAPPSRREFLHVAGSAMALGLLGRSFAASGSAPANLCFASASDLAAGIQARRFSAREVMAAHLQQINRLNARINAIVARLDDAACLALADAADGRLARGEAIGPLHGLPIAIKDTEPVIGFPFTRGSPIFRHDLPKSESVLVERVRAAGCLIIGKTNMPEFGMGSHTYNNVYGTTYNPYDLTKSAGGSSGGAGAALAAGMLPIAGRAEGAGLWGVGRSQGVTRECSRSTVRQIRATQASPCPLRQRPCRRFAATGLAWAGCAVLLRV